MVLYDYKFYHSYLQTIEIQLQKYSSQIISCIDSSAIRSIFDNIVTATTVSALFGFDTIDDFKLHFDKYYYQNTNNSNNNSDTINDGGANSGDDESNSNNGASEEYDDDNDDNNRYSIHPLSEIVHDTYARTLQTCPIIPKITRSRSLSHVNHNRFNSPLKYIFVLGLEGIYMHDTYSMMPLLIIDTASPHCLLNFSYFFIFCCSLIYYHILYYFLFHSPILRYGSPFFNRTI